MTRITSDIAFTPAVKAAQEARGSRENYRRMEEGAGWQSTITSDLHGFIAWRDSFYFGTASRDGQPYIQHRGGEPGFLKVLGEHTLGFADYVGNRQYISVGNLGENDRAFIFLMDYPNRRRIKIWGTASVVEGDTRRLSELADQKGNVPDRAIFFDVEAWDANCPKYITPRWTAAEHTSNHDGMLSRIKKLEQENRRLREQLN